MCDRSTTFLYIRLSIYLFTVIRFKYLYVLMTTVIQSVLMHTMFIKDNKEDRLGNH